MARLGVPYLEYHNLEGKEKIKAMLEATVPESKPGQWRIEGNVTSENGVMSGWFTFETAVSKGKGHIRLKDGKCWTLFSSLANAEFSSSSRLIFSSASLCPASLKTGAFQGMGLHLFQAEMPAQAHSGQRSWSKEVSLFWDFIGTTKRGIYPRARWREVKASTLSADEGNVMDARNTVQMNAVRYNCHSQSQSKKRKHMQVNISQEMAQVLLQAVRYAINMRQEFAAGDEDNSVDLAQAKAFLEGLSEAQKGNTGLTESDREVLGNTI